VPYLTATPLSIGQERLSWSYQERVPRVPLLNKASRWLHVRKLAAMTYDIIREAIIDRRSLTCLYDNCIRFFSPHILGKDADGRECAVVFQYAGKRPDGLFPDVGEWCCFHVDGIRRLRANGDRWVAGPIGGRPAGCVHEVALKA
jgi:hypothetical protein